VFASVQERDAIDRHSSYTVSVDVYDLVYQGIDYAGQAELITAEIRARRPEARSLLEAACGTGSFLVEFVASFDEVVGFDISEAMIAAAGNKVPTVDLYVADMRTFSLGRHFDAVVCLFSSIGYMVTEQDLESALASLSEHVAPGGVLVLDPWLPPDVFRPGHVSGSLEMADGIVVARIGQGRRDGEVSVIDMHHVVAREGTGVDYFVEEHRMGLFDDAAFRRILEPKGFVIDVAPVPWAGRHRLIAWLRNG
jgi:SAM-dependent methyltransferase